jgi:hypothetical protein
MAVYATPDGVHHRSNCGRDGAYCPTGEHGHCPGCSMTSGVDVTAPPERHEKGCPVVSGVGLDRVLRVRENVALCIARAEGYAWAAQDFGPHEKDTLAAARFARAYGHTIRTHLLERWHTHPNVADAYRLWHEGKPLAEYPGAPVKS